ncbi:hypothetical protein LR69_03187 [Geobacillus sp. BCO2]|nr:hypothetical protein LR69_03187 [Geobacillus sp. BCO2]
MKGFFAAPKGNGVYDGFLYLRGGIKNVGQVRVPRLIEFASRGFAVFAPLYRGNGGGEGNEDFAGDDRYDAFAGFELLRRHPLVHPGASICSASRAAGRWRSMPPLWRKRSVRWRFGAG